MSTLTHFPKSRLSLLIGRLGGISREEAVEAATKELQDMRPESDNAILSSIVQLENIVTGTTKHGDTVPIGELLPLCDQIVTLAGTFGYGALDKAARSLCDLLDGPLNPDKSTLASIRVHVQTMRLFAPGAEQLGEKQIEDMLFELARLLDHHGCATKADGGDCDDDFIVMAQ
jgi:hypothetical protein